jgi:hypothetical protein
MYLRVQPAGRLDAKRGVGFDDGVSDTEFRVEAEFAPEI